MFPDRLTTTATFLILALSGCQSEGGNEQSNTSGDTPSGSASLTSAVTGSTSTTTSSSLVTTISTASATAATTTTPTTSDDAKTSAASGTTSTGFTEDQSSSAVTSAEVTDGTNSGTPSSDVMQTSSADTSSSPLTDVCANALLCDDFEDDAASMPPGAPWSVDMNGGAVEISTERAFTGDKSVHISNTQGAYKRAYFWLDGDPVFPQAGQEMYGRMMMWLDATPAGSVHWTFIQGEGPSADGTYDIFYRYGGQHEGKLMANFETQGKATDCWDHSATVMPTKKWACLEWRFNVATDEMQFWLDGDEVADIHATGMGEGCGSQDLAGAWPAPAQFEVLRLGWEKYQESAAINAWIDDVAVGTSRVGCP